MVAVELDLSRERQLTELARSQGADVAFVAQQILSDYIDLLALPEDDAAIWADASVALTAELYEDEDWSKEPVP